MKNLFLTLATVVSIFMAASAQAASYTSTTVGDYTYHSGDISGTSVTVGDYTYHYGDISGTSVTVGDYTYHYID
jgi:hypothetical protein